MKRRKFFKSVALTGASGLILPGTILDGSEGTLPIVPETASFQPEGTKPMKIKEVKLYVLEDRTKKSSVRTLVQVPNLLRIQYTPGSKPLMQGSEFNPSLSSPRNADELGPILRGFYHCNKEKIDL